MNQINPNFTGCIYNLLYIQYNENFGREEFFYYDLAIILSGSSNVPRWHGNCNQSSVLRIAYYGKSIYSCFRITANRFIPACVLRQTAL